MAAYKSVRRKRMITLVVYTLMLLSAWTIYQLGVFAVFYDNIPILGLIIRNSIKYIIWTLPVLILLRHVYFSNPIEYLKLGGDVANGLVWGIAIGLIIVIYHAIRFFFIGDGSLRFDIDIYTWVHKIILIGFTEEVVFRGFILQKINEELEFIFANGIASILYVLIHIPRWYIDGLLQSEKRPYLLASAGFVLVFGLVQGYVLKKTKSLWACMVIHSINNLVTIIIGI
ncbi:MAG TPA: CPBP family intramembrane metalloprotease [Bacillota bacterium]|nr:CPBP family intramembrane metalloprotease [Bacillota bacterium]HOR85317.1 CPBP family intramembrane metalloprotease [Bacillota bacterium]HPL52546.1 CPBP family intramembrane metalloprotease [Bacillota bacterium]